MMEITALPEFGIFFTLVLYLFGTWVGRVSGRSWLNPLLVAILVGTTILVVFKIPYENYQNGGRFITAFLPPATVCLVIPFYKQLALFRSHWKVIVIGALVGTLAGLAVTIALLYAFDVPGQMRHAILVKNATGPIALEIADLLNRPRDLVMLMVSMSGLFGFVFGNSILKAAGITDPVARGVAFGSASHIVGTAKALENGPEEGAMSSVSILITGMLILFLVPVILRLGGM